MGMRARSGLAAALAVGLVIGGMATPVGVAAQEPSDDRHAGYYYPEHGTPEVYDARAYTLPDARSEEHTSELQSLMRLSYAVLCLKKINSAANFEASMTFSRITLKISAS